jgi:hypothetical protein
VLYCVLFTRLTCLPTCLLVISAISALRSSVKLVLWSSVDASRVTLWSLGGGSIPPRDCYEVLRGTPSARMSPSANKVRDGGNLLSRERIALPVVDVDDIIIRYPTALELVEHLRVMGETNAVLQWRQELPRDTAFSRCRHLPDEVCRGGR